MTLQNLGLFSALLYLLVAAAVGEPSCADVADFGPCSGETGDFCPGGIACSCKGEKPFCSCPFYRGPNGNYWYLGQKCDQLWSTLDMIAICVFPGVALAFVVAVTAQLIHFCKTKPKNKTVEEPKSKSEKKTTNTHQNKAFIPEEAPRNQYPDYSLGNVQEQARNPRRLNYYTDVPPASRQSNHFEGRQPSQSNGLRFPEQDYDSYDLRGQQQQFSRFSGAPMPVADYPSRAPEPTNEAWANRPFHFSRPQVKTNYDY